jgi:hypothetical protein
MHELLSPTDRAIAAERGWELCEIYDLKTQRWLRSILPTAANPNKNALATQQAVVAAAQQGDAVSLRALQALTPAPTKPTRKKR